MLQTMHLHLCWDGPEVPMPPAIHAIRMVVYCVYEALIIYSLFEESKTIFAIGNESHRTTWSSTWCYCFWLSSSAAALIAESKTDNCWQLVDWSQESVAAIHISQRWNRWFPLRSHLPGCALVNDLQSGTSVVCSNYPMDWPHLRHWEWLHLLKPCMFTPAIYKETFRRTIQAWGYHGFLPKHKNIFGTKQNTNPGRQFTQLPCQTLCSIIFVHNCRATTMQCHAFPWPQRRYLCWHHNLYILCYRRYARRGCFMWPVQLAHNGDSTPLSCMQCQCCTVG